MKHLHYGTLALHSKYVRGEISAFEYNSTPTKDGIDLNKAYELGCRCGQCGGIDYNYQIIWYLPDPVLDWKIPIAVLLRHSNNVEIGVATLLPNEESLGGKKRALLLQVGLDILHNSSNLREMFDGLGPHFIIRNSKKLIFDIKNPLQYLIENYLPHKKD